MDRISDSLGPTRQPPHEGAILLSRQLPDCGSDKAAGEVEGEKTTAEVARNQGHRLLRELWRDVPQGGRLLSVAFPGDPSTSDATAWVARALLPGAPLPFPLTWNLYLTTASFLRAPDGSYRRKMDYFAAAHAFMVDDVGTKLPLSLFGMLTPSVRVETSPGNFQALYLFDGPVTDRLFCGDLIRAFIAGQAAGTDPGMSGVTRVWRFPGFTNGKPAYNGFVCRLASFHPELRYAPGDLIEAFKLRLPKRRPPAQPQSPEQAEAHEDEFRCVEQFLNARGMLKRERLSDEGTWRDMECPWRDQHTGRVDTGAAIARPSEANGFRGGFNCFHGHCQHRGWRDLADWVAQQCEASMEETNRAAHGKEH